MNKIIKMYESNDWIENSLFEYTLSSSLTSILAAAFNATGDTFKADDSSLLVFLMTESSMYSVRPWLARTWIQKYAWIHFE